MKINLEAAREEMGAYFVDFTHVRKGKNYHAYIRFNDIKSWEREISNKAQDRATRWRLETVHGDVYYTLNSFIEIMDTNKWFPRRHEGSSNGILSNALLYREEEAGSRS